VETLPIQVVNASGMRALNTVNQPGTLPNWCCMNRYTSLRIKPFGFSIGARYGADSSRSFGS
jgi:hypothetical protein